MRILSLIVGLSFSLTGVAGNLITESYCTPWNSGVDWTIYIHQVIYEPEVLLPKNLLLDCGILQQYRPDLRP